MKRNPILTHPMTWMNLEILMPIETRQVQNTYIVGSHLYKVKNRQKQIFPSGPMVKTLLFQCRGHGFDP